MGGVVGGWWCWWVGAMTSASGVLLWALGPKLRNPKRLRIHTHRTAPHRAAHHSTPYTTPQGTAPQRTTPHRTTQRTTGAPQLSTHHGGVRPRWGVRQVARNGSLMVPLVEVPCAHFPRRELALREEAHTPTQATHITPSPLSWTDSPCSLKYVFPRCTLALREEACVS